MFWSVFQRCNICLGLRADAFWLKLFLYGFAGIGKAVRCYLGLQRNFHTRTTFLFLWEVEVFTVSWRSAVALCAEVLCCVFCCLVGLVSVIFTAAWTFPATKFLSFYCCHHSQAWALLLLYSQSICCFPDTHTPTLAHTRVTPTLLFTSLC